MCLGACRDVFRGVPGVPRRAGLSRWRGVCRALFRGLLRVSFGACRGGLAFFWGVSPAVPGCVWGRAGAVFWGLAVFWVLRPCRARRVCRGVPGCV